MARARAQAGTDADDVERWVRTYYAHVPPEDLAARTADELVGAALAHWSLMQQRLPGELKVRVYNPTLEEHGWESPHTVVEFVNDDMPFLVDSISMEITRHGSGLHLMIRPIVRVRRDEQGHLEDARRGRRHARVDDPRRGRPPDRPAGARRAARRPRARARRRAPPRSTTGRRCSRRRVRSSRTSSGARRPSTRRSSPRRSTCSSGCARPLHVPRLPRVRDRRRGRRGRAARSAGLRARHPAPDGRAADLGELRAAAAGRAAHARGTSTCST